MQFIDDKSGTMNFKQMIKGRKYLLNAKKLSCPEQSKDLEIIDE